MKLSFDFLKAEMSKLENVGKFDDNRIKDNFNLSTILHSLEFRNIQTYNKEDFVAQIASTSGLSQAVSESKQVFPRCRIENFLRYVECLRDQTYRFTGAFVRGSFYRHSTFCVPHSTDPEQSRKQ